MKFFKLKPGVPQIFDFALRKKLIQGHILALPKTPNGPAFVSRLKNKVILPATEKEYLDFLKKHDPEAYNAYKPQEAPKNGPLAPFTEAELLGFKKEELIEEYVAALEENPDLKNTLSLDKFEKLNKGEMVKVLLGEATA